VRLFTREQLVQLIESGLRVATGQVADLEGDFVVTGRVKLAGNPASGALLAVNGAGKDQDILGLPLF